MSGMTQRTHHEAANGAPILRPQLCYYNGMHVIRRTELAVVDSTQLFATQELHEPGASWLCAVTTAHIGEAVDLTVRFTLTAGRAEQVGVAMAITFPQWSCDNYVLLPAAVYNGNRFRSLPMSYPPLLRDPADHRPDLPLTISDVPRLNVGTGPSVYPNHR